MDHSNTNSLFKFPRTRHLFDAGGGVGRDDLVMDARELKAFLNNNHLILEEKIDGANLGISLTSDYQITFQNRSHYVTSQSATQWKGLESWLAQNASIFQVIAIILDHYLNFIKVLTPDIVIFGEWLYAKHSIHYAELPGYFIAFDVFDKKEQKFFSVPERNRILKDSGLPVVPKVAEGKFTKEQLEALLKSRSQFYSGPVEGIYIRVDDGLYLRDRAKIVRPDFLEKEDDGEVEHWSKKSLVKNIVKYA